MNPTIVHINKYEDFVVAVQALGIRGWAFRGQSDASWHIESSLARFYRTHSDGITSSSKDLREQAAIRKFRKAAHHSIAHLPDADDHCEWLAVMQHYGAPTRLIDFSYSPIEALYFAAETSVSQTPFGHHAKDSDFKAFRVDAVHIGAVNNSCKSQLKSKTSKKGVKAWFNEKCIGNSVGRTLDTAWFFEGSWQNPRQIAQQGLFLITSRIQTDVEQCLRDISIFTAPMTATWIQYHFPGGQDFFYKTIKNLAFANVTAASLFPGLEGLARSMGFRYFEKASGPE